MDIKTIKEKKAYERSAVKYQEDKIRRFKWYGANLVDFAILDNEMVNMIPENAKVLEVGCGDGRFAHVLHEKRKDVSYIGIDFIDDNIKLCKELKLKEYSFFVDNYWTALLTYSYDFIVSQGVLFSTTDPQYCNLLFSLLNKASTKGFIVMAIVMPMIGINKEDLALQMENVKETSIAATEFYYKGSKKNEPISKVPVRTNRIFYVIRDNVEDNTTVTSIPEELLNE